MTSYKKWVCPAAAALAMVLTSLGLGPRDALAGCELRPDLNIMGLTLVGPNLHGMFGRRAAALEGFDYSPGLRASGLVWTPRALEAWLQDPAGFVAGTKMTFTGYRSAEDRRDLIAYLLRATD